MPRSLPCDGVGGDGFPRGEGERADAMTLVDRLTALTGRVHVRAYRLLLDTPRVMATVPMIRGVWGRALRHVDERIYRYVFVGDGPPHDRLPRYLMRPAPPDPETAPAIDWILFADDADLEPVLLRAWDVACGMGLGADRAPFRVRRVLPVGPAIGRDARPAAAWPLSRATWPLGGAPDSTPCRLSFDSPLRLTGRGRLLLAPGFADIAAAALRRVAALAGRASGEPYRDLSRAVRAEADTRPAEPWRGERRDFVRWSGAQRREIDLRGVTGGLDLPQGPGEIWPLIAAARWTHVGKGAVFGLGQPRIGSLDRMGPDSPPRGRDGDAPRGRSRG